MLNKTCCLAHASCCWIAEALTLHLLPHRLLAFAANTLAYLPFKKCDEPYTVVHAINAITLRRGAFVLSAMKAALEAVPAEPPEPAVANNAQAETTPDADADEQEVCRHLACRSRWFRSLCSSTCSPLCQDRCTRCLDTCIDTLFRRQVNLGHMRKHIMIEPVPLYM